MGFILPTNLIIFKLSNIVNIEAIRWIIRAINVSGQFWIPLSIIVAIHGPSESNKNLLNLLVPCNSPHRIGISGTSTSLIGMIDHFGHTIVATNNS